MISAISTSPARQAENKPENIAKAAQDFEALLIAQVLRTARESGDSAEADSVMEMAESQFASILAANGGLGLAGMVTKGLSAAPPPPTHPQE